MVGFVLSLEFVHARRLEGFDIRASKLQVRKLWLLHPLMPGERSGAVVAKSAPNFPDYNSPGLGVKIEQGLKCPQTDHQPASQMLVKT